MAEGDRAGPKSITGLSAFLEEYSEEVEADLARYYQADLRDLWRGGGKLTYRRLQVFIDHLPSESATMTALRDSYTDAELAEISTEVDSTKLGPWSHVDLLLAGISDRLDWVVWSVFAAQGGKSKPPTPMRRPGVGAAPTRKHDEASLSRLRRLRNREVA